jgi:hypothetical protein
MSELIEIYNPKDLLDINDIVDENGAECLIFRIMNDIDLKGITFCPIGGRYKKGDPSFFCGEIHGQGHVIKNMVMESPGLNSIGFIYVNYGIIKDLYFDNTCSINGKSLLGTICSINSGDIINCKSSANIEGLDDIGGICGFNHKEGRLIDCSFYGKIRGTGSCVGGIVGSSDGKVTKSSYRGVINGESKIQERYIDTLE